MQTDIAEARKGGIAVQINRNAKRSAGLPRRERLSRVDAQVGVRDERCGEDAAVPQLAVERKIGELLELLPLLRGDAALDHRLVRGDFDGGYLHPAMGDLDEEPVDKGLRDGVLGIEGENDIRPARTRELGEEPAPEPVAVGHETRCAEGVRLQHLVHDEVVVVELEAGEGGEFPGHRVFAGGGGAVNKQEVHGGLPQKGAKGAKRGD